jgi:hypothetical protein
MTWLSFVKTWRRSPTRGIPFPGGIRDRSSAMSGGATNQSVVLGSAMTLRLFHGRSWAKGTRFALLIALGACGEVAGNGSEGSGTGSSGVGTGSGSSGTESGSGTSSSGTESTSGTGSGTTGSGSSEGAKDAGVDCSTPSGDWIFCAGEWRSGGNNVEPACPASGVTDLAPCSVSCVLCQHGKIQNWTCQSGHYTDSATEAPCTQ